MSSYLEQALASDLQPQGRFRTMLGDFLDQHSLFHLRATSQALKLQLKHCDDLLFACLFSHFPMQKGNNAISLEAVAQHCRHLTLIIGNAKTLVSGVEKRRPGPRGLNLPLIRSLFADRHMRSLVRHTSSVRTIRVGEARSPHPDAREMDRQLWQFLLARFVALNTLTVRVHGNPTWPGRTEVEENLILLRTVIERARPAQLRTLRLSPIHASGIIHLRWSSFGAYHEVPVTPSPWQNLTALTLNLHNPCATSRASADPALTPAQHLMFLKLLHSYLRSFAHSLRRLHFTWLDAVGPSPLLLDLVPSVTPTIAIIHWAALREFYFANITFPHQTLRLLPDRAPRITVVKALRSTCAEPESVNVEDAEAWIDIPLDGSNLRRDEAAYAASSIYSQGDMDRVFEWDDGHDDARASRVTDRSSTTYRPPRTNWRRLTDSRGSLLSRGTRKASKSKRSALESR